MNYNYYEEIYNKIKSLYENGEYDEASRLLNEELNAPYVPKDFEAKLNELLNQYKAEKPAKKFSLTDQQIEEYLKDDAVKQMIAVDYLNTLNLRSYLEIVEHYLTNEKADRNAKALLIASLIEQDINQEVKLNKDGLIISFIPRYAEPIVYTDGFESGLEFLKEALENDNPSMYDLAFNLLTRVCYLNLPFGYETAEGICIAKSIVLYLFDCFNDNQAKQIFIKKYIVENEKLVDIESML